MNPPRFNGLQAQAETDANQRHSRRLAELKALAPLLAQLDELMPSLTAQGLKLYPDQIGLTHLDTGMRRMKVLRLDVASIFDKTRPVQWQDALLKAGFATVKHFEAGEYSHAVMRRGSLLLQVTAPTLGPVRRIDASAVRRVAAAMDGSGAPVTLVDATVESASTGSQAVPA
jgi:hypothetical protein